MTHCPKCRHPFSAPPERCPRCGADLAWARDLFVLERRLRETRATLHREFERLGETESRLAATRKKVARLLYPASVRPPVSAKPAFRSAPAPSPKPSSPPRRTAASEIQLGQIWILVAGILVLVLGFGYFLKYSFSRNWIPPLARVLLVFLAGGGLIAAGDFFRRGRARIFGLYLCGGGIATLYFGAFASSELYAIWPRGVSFFMMIAITLLAGILAFRFDARWLAAIGLTGGFLTPLVLSSGRASQATLMTYIAVLNAGVLALAVLKPWGLLNRLSFLFTWFLFAGWHARFYHSNDFALTLFFVNLFFLIHASNPFARFLSREQKEPVRELWISVLNPLIALGYTVSIVVPLHGTRPVSIAALAYAGVFFAMARLAKRRNPGLASPRVLLYTQAVFFLVAAVPFLFTKHWITVFWAAQAIALFYAGDRLKDHRILKGALLLSGAALAKYFFYDQFIVFGLEYPRHHWMTFLRELFSFRAGYAPLAVARWIAALSCIALAAAASRILSRLPRTPDFDPRSPREFMTGLFYLLPLLFCTVEVSALANDYFPAARSAAVSILWALSATGLMVRGFLAKNPLLRKSALWFFGATLFKVFLVDLSEVSTPFRILSCMILGALLILTSYLYHRYRDVLEPRGHSPEAEDSA